MNCNFSIEQIDTKAISETDLKKIVEIEQDMWAREDGLGEYVKCNNCFKIHSKDQVFKYLGDNIRKQTVAQIENIIGIDTVYCPDCKGKTEFIYDRNMYVEQVKKRYECRDSVLSVIRDSGGEVRGFFDGYKSNFFDIYVNEFLSYYGDLSISEIFSLFSNKFFIDFSKDLFVSTALGMEEKYTSFFNLYRLMLHFYSQVYDKFGDIDGIYESRLGTNTHALYELTGARKLGISSNQFFYSRVKNVNPKFISDIFFHKHVAEATISVMSIPVKDFIRINRVAIKKVTKFDHNIGLKLTG